MTTPVCKEQEEGHRAMQRLQIIWIDLAGPMSVQSHTGNKYIMDLVDNYTNMPWSIPLKSKSNTFTALQIWQKAREHKTVQKVETDCTGHDSELKSHQMEA